MVFNNNEVSCPCSRNPPSLNMRKIVNRAAHVVVNTHVYDDLFGDSDYHDYGSNLEGFADENLLAAVQMQISEVFVHEFTAE